VAVWTFKNALVA